MEKGKEIIAPGIIYVPWTVKLEMPDCLKGGSYGDWSNSIVVKLGPKKKYEILLIKEFIRRKKMLSKYSEAPINEKKYEIYSTSIKETETEVTMDINLIPKKSPEFIKMNMTILPNGEIKSI